MSINFKKSVITAVTCIAIGASACSYAENYAASSADEDQSVITFYSWPEITEPEYNIRYASESQIPYQITIDNKCEAERVLYLTIEIPEDTATLRTEDENWLFLTKETDHDNKNIKYTYAYRKYTGNGEIVFMPILETENGISEDEFSAISANLIFLGKSRARDEVYDAWERNGIGFASLVKIKGNELTDETLQVVYQQVIPILQEDPKTADPELIVGEQYHVLDIYRNVDNGVYYCKGVMEDADGNRIAVDLSNDNDTIIVGDTVVYRGEQTFDIVKEEIVNEE